MMNWVSPITSCSQIKPETKRFRYSTSMKIFVAFLLSAATVSATTRSRSLRGDAFSGAVESFDCAAGCSLDRNTMGPPVCGDNGISYFNACLACCQGISVDHEGACAGNTEMENFEDMESEDPELRGRLVSFDQDTFVDVEVMNRFQAENFTLVAKRTVVPMTSRPSSMDAELNTDAEPTEESIQAVRLSSDLYEYVANVPLPTSEEGDTIQETLPSLPEDEEGHDRALAITPDPRSKVTSFAPPAIYVGELDYNGVEGGCSGTVISRTAVLTAGHCVYQNGRWSPHTGFAPRRYRSTSGTTIEPYGTYQWDSITTFKAWTQSSSRAHDIAVIKYKPRSGKYLGDVVGHAGLRKTAWNSPSLNDCEIRGYPGEKLNGEMWTSGKCPGTYTFDIVNPVLLVRYECDTSPGMSGSALMDSAGYVSAVYALSFTSNNGGALLNGGNYDSIVAWK